MIKYKYEVINKMEPNRNDQFEKIVNPALQIVLIHTPMNNNMATNKKLVSLGLAILIAAQRRRETSNSI